MLANAAFVDERTLDAAGAEVRAGMPTWLVSVLFAVLVVTIPYSLILKIMLQLPQPLARSHRRWSLPANFAVIGGITAYVAIFIRSVYYVRGSAPTAVLMEFFIAAVAYVFGLVLILRQFSGVYPEYIVTTGRTGLSLRKTAYPNITDVQTVSEQYGESRLRIVTSHGKQISFTLPARDVSIFYERLKPPMI